MEARASRTALAASPEAVACIAEASNACESGGAGTWGGGVSTAVGVLGLMARDGRSGAAKGGEDGGETGLASRGGGTEGDSAGGAGGTTTADPMGWLSGVARCSPSSDGGAGIGLRGGGEGGATVNWGGGR